MKISEKRGLLISRILNLQVYFDIFIELFIKNLATMTYHKSLRFEITLEVFSFVSKKRGFFFFKSEI